MEEAGFHRYEVANYALPGFESRHNSSDRSGVPYLGLGRSATTMTQNAQRRMRVCDGQVTDDLNPAQMRAEDSMLAMRMARGVTEAQVEEAARLLPAAPSAFAQLEELGLVVSPRRAALSPPSAAGFCGNELYGRILDLAP